LIEKREVREIELKKQDQLRKAKLGQLDQKKIEGQHRLAMIRQREADELN
jgi:hypothetical protein